MDISTLLLSAQQANASDLHLSSGLVPWLRINGKIAQLNGPNISHDTLLRILYELIDSNQKKLLEKNHEIDFAISLSGINARVNAFYYAKGVRIVFRIIPSQIKSIDELKLPSVFKKIATYSQGLVLVTGPTGCGKTTTIAAMLDFINQNQQRHILTIEDPIEYIYQSKNSLVTQRDLSKNSLNVNSVLKSALRSDPDVILIGEMRDEETFKLALRAAETGHLVFATLHSSSAVRSINRIIEMFQAAEQALIKTMLSESLQAVIGQKLISNAQGERVAIFDIMICNPAIRNMIKEGKVSQIYSAMQTGKEFGMQTMDLTSPPT